MKNVTPPGLPLNQGEEQPTLGLHRSARAERISPPLEIKRGSGGVIKRLGGGMSLERG